MGQPTPDYPPLRPDIDLVRLRMRLIREEFDEVMKELVILTVPIPVADTIVCLRNLLKELADLRYVVEGTAVSLGLPFEAAYAEVHRSNMTKDPVTGGKAVKGAGYSPADMHQFVHDLIEQED